MTDNKIPDNISEKSALDHAENVLWEYFIADIPDSGPFAAERARRFKAFDTIHALIQKERNIPIGTGLERLTELAKGIRSGYIVFTPVNLGKHKFRVEFFHTIHREIIGSIVFERKSGYYRIKHIEFSAF